MTDAWRCPEGRTSLETCRPCGRFVSEWTPPGELYDGAPGYWAYVLERGERYEVIALTSGGGILP